MSAIIINSKDPKNLKLLMELAEKLGEKGNKLDATQLEDFALGTLMDDEKTGTDVSRDEVFKKLHV